MAKAKRSSGRKKSASASTSTRVKIGKKVFTKEGCSKLKSVAKKKAESIRKSGKLARVVKNASGGHCVLSASKSVRRNTTRRKTAKR